MKRNTRLRKFMRYFNGNNVTRSYGFLEYFLAILRARMAHKIISKEHKRNRILDIGCSSYPIFLLTSKFVEKFGIDKQYSAPTQVSKRFKLVHYDLEKDDLLPFEESFFDVVSMLAVIEHLEFNDSVQVLSEVYRVLKPGGICIITVPSTWTDKMLHTMAHLSLISRVEIEDHRSNLRSSRIVKILRQAKFSAINSGYFEFFMNRWFVAMK